VTSMSFPQCSVKLCHGVITRNYPKPTLGFVRKGKGLKRQKGPKGGNSVSWRVYRPNCEPGAGHTFAQTTLLKKVTLKPSKLLIEQVARDLDQANNNVGTNSRFGVLNAFLERLISCAGRPVELS
jgi:hypothetical protein